MLGKRSLQQDAQQMLGHDGIAAALGAEIISGLRPPGSRMPSPPEFFERFGASRVVLREVNKTLAAKGMLSAKTKVGTQVMPAQNWNWFDPQLLAWRVSAGLDVGFLLQLAEMRRGVEPCAASLAAGRRTVEQMKDIDGAVEAMRRASADRIRYVEADIRFHEAVCAASGNPMFLSFARVIEVALRALFSVSIPRDDDAIAKNVASHAVIAVGIADRDPDKAARATLEVIGDGVRRFSGEDRTFGAPAFRRQSSASSA